MHAAVARLRVAGLDPSPGETVAVPPWFDREGVVDPDRLAAVLAPGFRVP